MPADNSYYNGRKLDHIDPDDVITEHREALYLGLTKDQVKERFYLDYVHEIIADGIVGFIGGCEVGSVNYEMHNTARVGMIKFMAESASGNSNWREYKAYMDGGLNTKGKATLQSVISSVFTSFTVDILFKSAYHFNSLSYGFEYRWRNDQNTAWESWIQMDFQAALGVILADASKNEHLIVPINRPVDHMILAQVRPFYTNSEGTPPGDILTLYPTLKPISLQLNGWTNNPTTYYVNDDEIIAGGNQSSFTGLWLNPDMTGGRITNNMQLWIDARYYYTYGYDVPNDIWCFTALTDNNPPDPDPTYTTYAFDYYVSNMSLTPEQISDLIMNNSIPRNFGTIYKENNSDVWHNTNQFNSVVSNGWYVIGNVALGATRAIRIVSGEIVEEWEYEK